MAFRLLPKAERVTNKVEAREALAALTPKPLIAFDTETSGLDLGKDRAILLSLSEGARRWAVWPQMLPYFQDLMEDPSKRLIAHNAKFDMWMLRNIGIDVDRYTAREQARVYDTMVMHALVDDAAPHDLKYLSRQYLDIEMVPFKALYGREMQKRTLAEIFVDPAFEAVNLHYSSLDAYATYKLFLVLQHALVKEKLELNKPGQFPYDNLWEYFTETEVLFTKVLWHMERRGIELDVEKLLERAPELDKQILAIEKWFCHKLRRYDINLKSNPQMCDLFFNKLGHVPLSFTAGGSAQLNATALKLWAKQGCEYSANLLAYRDLTKNLGTYVTGLLNSIHADGRIHTRYGQTGARTGRLSCVAGPTVLRTSRGDFPISAYVPHENDLITTHTGQWKKILRKINKGLDAMYRVRLDNGAVLWCTVAHQVLAPTGWRSVGTLAVGDEVWSYHGDFQDVYREPGQRDESARPVPIDREADDRLHRDYAGHYAAECPCCGERPPIKRAPERGAGFEVFPIKGGGSQSDEREKRSTASQLRGGCSDGRRLSSTEGGRRVRTGTSDRHGGAAGSTTAAGIGGGSPHRRRQDEQQSEQSGFGDSGRAPGLARQKVQIREIAFVGTMEVWDLEVEGDHSYLSQGFINHNSSDPNLQNQPPYIRDAYRAKPGYRLFARDQQQLEMRILAHVSKDAALCEAIRAGKDVHSATAANMYHVPYEDIMAAKHRDDLGEVLSAADKQLLKYRKGSKTLNFGIMYGMGKGKLAKTLGVTEDEAEDIITRYFAAVPGVAEYFKRVLQEVYINGFSYTELGRRRRLPGIWSLLKGDRKRAERQAKNAPIQGFASEILKVAQNKIFVDPLLVSLDVNMLLQIHDELVFELPEAYADNEQIQERIMELMTMAICEVLGRELLVPLDTSGKGGVTWADCK